LSPLLSPLLSSLPSPLFSLLSSLLSSLFSLLSSLSSLLSPLLSLLSSLSSLLSPLLSSLLSGGGVGVWVLIHTNVTHIVGKFTLPNYFLLRLCWFAVYWVISFSYFVVVIALHVMCGV
jgi:hypothetical protein